MSEVPPLDEYKRFFIRFLLVNLWNLSSELSMRSLFLWFFCLTWFLSKYKRLFSSYQGIASILLGIDVFQILKSIKEGGKVRVSLMTSLRISLSVKVMQMNLLWQRTPLLHKTYQFFNRTHIICSYQEFRSKI